MDKRSPTPIYHFTHAKNLSDILSTDHIYCKSWLPNSDQLVNVSHQNIQEKRRNKQIGCPPGGILHDYVPFYFAPRSPMMYVISRGGVEGYDSNTKPLIYLVSSVERVQELDLRFAFSDGRPIMLLTRFYNDVAALNKVDWEAMEARMWTETEEDPDPDKSRRRQAEFLVYREFPWDAVEFLAVKNRSVKDRLDRHLSERWPERVKPVKVVTVQLWFGEQSVEGDIQGKSSEERDPLEESLTRTLESVKNQLEEGAGKEPAPSPES